MKTMANRPELICEARAKGQLSLEAEMMIEEITESFFDKHLPKKKKKSKK